VITAKEIKPLYKQAVDYAETEQLKTKLARLRRERQPLYLTAAEFDEILRWKLIQQYGRVQHLLVSNTDEIIRAVTGLALTITHPDNEYELELRMDILCALRGVSTPVASAVLALVFPEEYAVIDFRGWRQLFDEKRDVFSTPDYKKYMYKIRQLANELGWPVQEADHAIWEYDRRSSK
jgi:hypothetical protein